MLLTTVSRLCLPLPVTWEVMWHWTVKVLNLYALPQKRHLGCSLSQPPECFLTRSSAEIVLRSSSWSVSYSGVVVWNFCMSSSCKPLLWIISSGYRQDWGNMTHIHWVPRQNKLEIPNDEEEVNTREIHKCDGQVHDPDTMVVPSTTKPTRKAEGLTKKSSPLWDNGCCLLWINKAKAKDKIYMGCRCYERLRPNTKEFTRLAFAGPHNEDPSRLFFPPPKVTHKGRQL